MSPLQCKEIKARLSRLFGLQPQIAVLAWQGEERMRLEQRNVEERRKGVKCAEWWGRADGGVICVGCTRWRGGGNMAVCQCWAMPLVLKEINLGAVRERRAYNNWILLLTISFTCRRSALNCREKWIRRRRSERASEWEIVVWAKLLERFKCCTDNNRYLK